VKTVLITDSQTELGLSLVKLFLDEKYQVVSAYTENTVSKAIDSLQRQGLLAVKWNRPSRLSAKNLIFKIRNSFSSLEAAFILCFGPPDQAGFPAINPLYLEHFLDKHLKGSLFLIQELLNYFARQGKGWLTLIFLKQAESDSFFKLYHESLLELIKYLAKAQAFASLHLNAIKISKSGLRQNGQSLAPLLYKAYQEKCNKSNGKVFSL